jgi:Fuc2NAc and GlcNAc transferase
MGIETALAVVAAFVVSAVLTGVARRSALLSGMIDVPNERSSHEIPTPRGGGIAIVVATTAVVVILAVVGALRLDVLAAVCGGLPVAVVGYLDDRRRLSARVRLAVHFAAAAWALTCLGGLPPVLIGEHLRTWGAANYVWGMLGVVWILNLFNFMDGIDGIATAEAVFIAVGGALLTIVTSSDISGTGAACLTLAAASAGFLLWNWPPARIFMGDVGSGYLGYVIAVLALVAMRENPVALWSWLILGGLFFADATITLVRRTLRGERLHEAHRSHAYQWLSRRWGSHRRVTVATSLVNVLWLLPCALLASLHPHYAAWITCGALTPVTLALVFAGSGRKEIRSQPAAAPNLSSEPSFPAASAHPPTTGVSRTDPSPQE